MQKIRKIYCRTFQTAFKIALPFLPYRTPEIIGSVKGIPDIKEEKVQHCTDHHRCRNPEVGTYQAA
mgnify:CR=1 FL=1